MELSSVLKNVYVPERMHKNYLKSIKSLILVVECCPLSITAIDILCQQSCGYQNKINS